jgi:class 3 adenylate cyclase
VSARNAVTDALIVGLASGVLHLTSIGHAAYARPDIIGPTVNTAYRVHGWAATHAKGRISAAFLPDVALIEKFDLVVHRNVALKGLESALDIIEITGRRTPKATIPSRHLPT